MKKLHYTITINAPRKHVYKVMLEKPTYNEWTTAFSEHSDYEGAWDQGSQIKFVDGSGNGMISEIAENKPNEYVSIHHLGEIQDGKEKRYDPADGYENYTLEDADGGTKVTVEMVNLPDEYEGMFNEMWPKALDKLKEIAEASK